MTPWTALAETHTGVVLFRGDRAYKMKKPLDLGFVDNSTTAARRRACEVEVELNRRLAPDVYLGVGELREPGPAEPEPLVVMRRLPAEQRLSALVERGVHLDDHLRHVAHAVAGFHGRCPATDVARAAAGPVATRARWVDNAEALARSLAGSPEAHRAEAVRRAAERYLDGRAPLLEGRIAAGWARDGHGDLLADDVFCLDDGPRVLDCLEFDERLRQGDVLADVAFLAMDLERLGRPDLGWALLEQHRELLGDEWPASLAHHHVAYRAQVRAKVACIRAEQAGGLPAGAARELLELAERHLAAAAVRLVVVGGLPGTGKSTLAAGLAGPLDAVVVRSDEVRKELAGVPAGAGAPAPVGEGIYDRVLTGATYAEVLDRARHLLGQGRSVVLDASWADPAARAEARALARDTASDLAELRCHVPPDLARARMAHRAATGGDPSDATAEVHAAMAAAEVAWPEAVDVDTTGDPDGAVARALAAVAPAPGRP